ncbi:MAG: type I glyceraldehyde-3-phosphate dehydrogenase [Salibacteraceae bacterium]
MKRIAINGFGRIGRLTLRNLLQTNDVEVVAINDLSPSSTAAHLFKYDSAHGVYSDEVLATEASLHVGSHAIKYSSIKNPEELPWAELNIDLVLECTGVFRTKEKAQLHQKAGAKKVIISAPAKGEPVPFVVLGVNEEILTPEIDIISNASCTTNCLAPVVQLVNDTWGISHGFITTTHAYTADQRLQDAPHSDLRRARAAAHNIIPTTTGAGEALGVVIPSLKGKLHASAMRVPVITGSLIELTCVVNTTTTVEEINAAFKKASENEFSGILQYNEDAIVSSDIVGNKYSSIFDAPLTNVHGNLIKVTSWYDNESGYAARMADLALKMTDL